MSFDSGDRHDPSRPTVHATALILGGVGLLIRGSSGAGKSRLAWALLEGKGARPVAGPVLDGEEPGSANHSDETLKTALIADDQVALVQQDKAIIARTPQGIEGLIELRAIGLVAVPWRRSCRVDLVVDLIVDLAGADAAERLPTHHTTQIEQVVLPALKLSTRDLAHQTLLVRTAIELFLSNRF